MKIKCPACGFENPDDVRGCQRCPESFEFEDDPDRPKHKFNRFDPTNWTVGVWFCVLAAVGVGGWKFLMLVMDLGESGAKNPISRMVEYRTSVPDQDIHDLPGTHVTPGSAKVTMKLRKDKADEPAGNPGDWHMNGTVRDLETLAPIPDVELVFNGKASRLQATTDDEGHYSLIAPPMEHGGYFVSIHKEGYAKTYLNPGAEKVPEMPLEDRRGLAQDLNHANDGPYEVVGSGEEPLTTDFFVAAKK